MERNNFRWGLPLCHSNSMNNQRSQKQNAQKKYFQISFVSMAMVSCVSTDKATPNIEQWIMNVLMGGY